MSMMKTNLTTTPMCPRERFSFYKSSSRLVLCYKKGLGHLVAPYLLCLLVTRYYLSYHKTIYHLQFQCLQKTLLKTAYHFLLLLVGFDTLTCRKDYDRSPILVGHHTPSWAARYSSGPIFHSTGFFWSIKIIKNWHINWTPFGIAFV